MAKKGCIPWNKNRKCPEISQALIGKPKSLEHRKNLSIWAKKRIGELAANWKGGQDTKKCQLCQKLFKINPCRNKTAKFCSIKCLNINNAHNISDETRHKMSLAAKGTSKPWAKQNIRIASTVQQNMKGPTSIERKIYEELQRRGLLFEKQKLINGKFLVDAYIPSLNLVIEADGDYWHSREDVIKKDKSKNAYLTKCGFNLLRLTETEINKNVKISIDRMYN